MFGFMLHYLELHRNIGYREFRQMFICSGWFWSEELIELKIDPVTHWIVFLKIPSVVH